MFIKRPDNKQVFRSTGTVGPPRRCFGTLAISGLPLDKHRPGGGGVEFIRVCSPYFPAPPPGVAVLCFREAVSFPCLLSLSMRFRSLSPNLRFRSLHASHVIGSLSHCPYAGSLGIAARFWGDFPLRNTISRLILADRRRIVVTLRRRWALLVFCSLVELLFPSFFGGEGGTGI